MARVGRGADRHAHLGRGGDHLGEHAGQPGGRLGLAGRLLELGQRLEDVGDAQRLLAGAGDRGDRLDRWHRDAGPPGEARVLERSSDDGRDPDEAQLAVAVGRQVCRLLHGPHGLRGEVGDPAEVDGVDRLVGGPREHGADPVHVGGVELAGEAEHLRAQGGRPADVLERAEVDAGERGVQSRRACLEGVEAVGAHQRGAGSSGELVQPLLEGEHVVDQLEPGTVVGGAGDGRVAVSHGSLEAVGVRLEQRRRHRPPIARAPRRPRPAPAARGRPSRPGAASSGRARGHRRRPGGRGSPCRPGAGRRRPAPRPGARQMRGRRAAPRRAAGRCGRSMFGD